MVALWVAAACAVITLLLAAVIAALYCSRPEPVQISENPGRKYDERDLVFVRQKLQANTPRYEQYYASNPDKKAADDHFRAQPGLLNPDARFADPFLFRSVRGSLNSIYALLQERNGLHLEDKRLTCDPLPMSTAIKGWCRHFGALSAGICLLEEHHKYSHHGYRELYGTPVELTHRFAVAFTLEMDLASTMSAPQAPIWLESARQYENGANIATQLAIMIRHMGWSAKPHFFDNYDLVAPLVARDAGLGEIGRMAILMTPEAGPRVRLGGVTTDLPLVPDGRRRDQAVLDFCAACDKCARSCPAKAIPSGPPGKDGGACRWRINDAACYTYWAKTGNPCGRCMAVCPLSHPGNLMRSVPWGFVRTSRLFHAAVLAWDDWTYGKTPAPWPPPDWMTVTMEKVAGEVHGKGMVAEPLNEGFDPPCCGGESVKMGGNRIK